MFSASSTISHCEPVQAPWQPSASAAAICSPLPMPPAASTGTGRDGLDDLGPQHDRADLAAVAAALAALGDDDVDVGGGVLQRLVRRAAQRRDLAALVVDVVDHVRGRGAERVGDQRHLRVLQRDLDLRGGRRLGPAEQLQRVVVLALLERHAVVEQEVAGEVEVLLGDHVLRASWSRSSVDMSASMPSYLFGMTMSTP